MGIGKNRIKGVVIFIISLFVVMKLVGQTRICVMNDLSGFQNSFSLNLKPGKGEFSACTPCKACFGKGKWRLTNKENEYQLCISIFGYYDTTMTITEKDSFLVINLQERETFNELENNEIHQSPLPFLIWIKDSTYHRHWLKHDNTYIPYPNVCISEDVRRFEAFCKQKRFQYDTLHYNYLLYFCEGNLYLKPLSNRDGYNPYTEDLRYLPIEQLSLIPYALKTVGVNEKFSYLIFKDETYFKIKPSIVLSIKKEITPKELKKGLFYIKKGYRTVKSYGFNYKFKMWNIGGYGMGFKAIGSPKENKLLHYRNLSFPSQHYMKQFRKIKKLIKSGESNISFELLYPPNLLYWTDLFIDSGIFTSVYIEKEVLTSEMFR